MTTTTVFRVTAPLPPRPTTRPPPQTATRPATLPVAATLTTIAGAVAEISPLPSVAPRVRVARDTVIEEELPLLPPRASTSLLPVTAPPLSTMTTRATEEEAREAGRVATTTMTADLVACLLLTTRTLRLTNLLLPPAGTSSRLPPPRMTPTEREVLRMTELSPVRFPFENILVNMMHGSHGALCHYVNREANA